MSDVREFLMLVVRGIVVCMLVVTASFISTSLAFPLFEQLPSRGRGWFISSAIVLTFGVPAAAGGLVAAVACVRTRARYADVRPTRRHFLWCAGSYVLPLAGLAILVPQWTNRDFRLVGQIVLWPSLSCAAAIGVDGGLSLREHRRRHRRTPASRRLAPMAGQGGGWAAPASLYSTGRPGPPTRDE